jgi:hypothetical protein
MKKALFFIISLSLLLLSKGLMAQDLIVTTAGDSLNCKITRQSNGFVYFKYLKDNQAKATLLPVNKISSVVQAYYEVPAISKQMLTSQNRDYSKWRYGFHGGYSYRTAKVSDQLTPDYKDYIKKLKSGFVLGADVHGFTSEAFGLGLKYNLNKYKAEQGTDFHDDITLHYIAASMLNRYILANPKNHILLGLNMGYQSYRDKTAVIGNDFDIKGKTLGIGFEAGFEHQIGTHALLNFGISFNGATITKISVNNGTPQKLNKENYESLARLELTAGLKFGK